MPAPTIHGKRLVFSASSVLEAVASELTAIKSADRLTYADIGRVLGKSEDQAAKYCDGTAEMGIVAFASAKREWNGRFTGALDRLCVDSRPATDSDRAAGNKVLKAALALAEALEDDNAISSSSNHSNNRVSVRLFCWQQNRCSGEADQRTDERSPSATGIATAYRNGICRATVGDGCSCHSHGARRARQVRLWPFRKPPVERVIELRPDPDYRRRRMSHLSPERATRAFAAVACVSDRNLAERTDAARRERVAAIKGWGG